MLESIKFRPLSRRKGDRRRRSTLDCGKIVSPRQVAVLLALALAVVVVLGAFDAAGAYRRFMKAFWRISSDFNYSVSRDVGECGVLLWTRRNRKEPQVIQGNVTMDKLRQTNFDRSGGGGCVCCDKFLSKICYTCSFYLLWHKILHVIRTK